MTETIIFDGGRWRHQPFPEEHPLVWANPWDAEIVLKRNAVLALAAKGVIEFKASDGRHAAVVPEPYAEAAGSWRASWYDAHGFSGHSTRDTRLEVLTELAELGYVEAAPGSLDLMSATETWRLGMEAAERVLRHNQA